MANEIKPGTGGRPWGCFYFKEDHERAAQYVREHAPEFFESLEQNPDGIPSDLRMLELMFRTAMELLPRASLVDLSKIGLILRLQAHPLSPESQARLESALLRQRMRRQ